MLRAVARVTVYRIEIDQTRYRSIEVVDPNLLATRCPQGFDGRWVSERGLVIPCRFRNPQLPKADFMGFVPGAFVLTEDAMRRVGGFQAAEFFPVYVEGDEYYVANVIQVFNALDRASSEIEPGADGSIRIKRYAFHRNRLLETGVFKLPETALQEVLVFASENDDPEDSFPASLAREQFSGVSLAPLWSAAM
jgi:hypothetical protein